MNTKRENHDEHQDLLRKMERVAERNGRSLDKERILQAFDDLLAATASHFRTEELCMTAMAYPAMDQHKRIHNQLLSALLTYRDEFLRSVNGRFPQSVFDFFRTWMTTHIMLVDRQYAVFRHDREACGISSTL